GLLVGPRRLELLDGGAAALVGAEHGVHEGRVLSAGTLAGPDDVGLVTQELQVDHHRRISAPPWGSVSACLTGARWRSEEHTSELQSRFDLVCRLLLEKTIRHAQT